MTTKALKSAVLFPLVALGGASTTTIYTLEKAPECGQVDFPAAYLKEAMAFDKNLKVGTCASVGYTVPDGETTKTEPVVGTLTIKKFLKPSGEFEFERALAGIDAVDKLFFGKRDGCAAYCHWCMPKCKLDPQCSDCDSVAVPSTTVRGIWSNCGTSSDILSDVSVTITPNPPVKGKTLTVDASGKIASEITSGNINAVIDILGIPVINKNIDLCSASPKVTCPIPAGQQSLELSQLIPSSVPSGDYTGKVVATNQDGKQIACVNLKFSL
jgi:hypothetical protein